MKITKGTDVAIKIIVTENALPVDITGYTFFYTVKAGLSDTDEQAVIRKDWTTHTDGVNGITHLELTNTETSIDAGNYLYDIKIKSPGGAISAIEYGKCQILDRVTIRTS